MGGGLRMGGGSHSPSGEALSIRKVSLFKG